MVVIAPTLPFYEVYVVACEEEDGIVLEPARLELFICARLSNNIFFFFLGGLVQA